MSTSSVLSILQHDHWVLRALMCQLGLLSQNLVTTVGILLLS